jgi:hypothetical protein
MDNVHKNGITDYEPIFVDTSTNIGSVKTDCMNTVFNHLNTSRLKTTRLTGHNGHVRKTWVYSPSKIFYKRVRLNFVRCTDMLKMTVFWDVVPCSLIDIQRRFKGAYCLHYQGDD